MTLIFDLEALDFPTPRLTPDDLYEAVRESAREIATLYVYPPMTTALVTYVPETETFEERLLREHQERVAWAERERIWREDVARRRREREAERARRAIFDDHFCFCSPSRYQRLSSFGSDLGGPSDWSSYNPPGVYADGRQGPTVASVSSGGGGGRLDASVFDPHDVFGDVSMTARSWIPGDIAQQVRRDVAEAFRVEQGEYNASMTMTVAPEPEKVPLWAWISGGTGLLVASFLALLAGMAVGGGLGVAAGS